jgi:hypothetical protein
MFAKGDPCSYRGNVQLRRPHSKNRREEAIVVVEIDVPDDWMPGQILTMRQLLQHAVRTAVPVITMVRKDVTADQLEEV